MNLDQPAAMIETLESLTAEQRKTAVFFVHETILDMLQRISTKLNAREFVSPAAELVGVPVYLDISLPYGYFGVLCAPQADERLQVIAMVNAMNEQPARKS